MPVSSSIQVSLSEVLQVRGGPLEEEELWSILCQSCKAIQDIFIQGRAIAADGPSFVVSPYTVLFSPTGTVQFAESIDVTLPNIANYLPPEGIGGQGSFSNAAVEKMYIYALGKSLLWASDYMRIPYSSAVIGATLQTLLMGMSDNNPVTRLGLVQILEACTIHAQSLGYGMPYARHIMQLSKIVLGSIFALDQMADSFNSNTNNSVSTVTGSPMSAGRSPEHRRSGRVSPGKRNHQQLNSSDSTDHKHKRTMRDYDEPDSRRGSRSKPRSRGYSNLSSSTMDSQDSYDDVRSHKDSLPRNRSSRNSREMLDERSSRRDASHRSNASSHGNGSEGRSYHMSDIFSPANQTEKSNGYRALSEKSSHSRRSDSKHSKTHSMSRGYESLPDRPSSRSKQRSPPPRGGKSSRTNLVYERLRERRERLGRLRDQLGLRPRYGKELTRSVSDYDSETDTMTEDESQYGDRRSEARSYKSLTSVESARQGSYHPDQYSQYSSFGTLPFGQGLPSSSPQRQSRSVPNVHQQRAADHYDGVSNRDPSLERRLQAAPSSNEHRRNTVPSRKKLKKFFGPEFVVMSSEPNESITMPISFLSKAGKIPPEKKRVTAVMLNGRRLDLLCDLGTSGQELFDLIASHLGLNERSYFGLAYIKDGEYLFIDPDTKLYKVGPESWREEAKKRSKKLGSKEKFTVFFRVKYYVENVSLLRDQLTRHQYYLQLRRDILEERTKCDERSALQLAALALQAEMGDHDAGTSRNYFLPEHYVAAGMIESIGVANIRDRLPPLHEAQKGISDVDAELDFLMEARKLPEYGIHFHRVTHNKKETSRGVWLGVCTRGIIVYEKSGKVRKQVHAHPWNKTKKIAFDRRKFIVEPYDETGMRFVHFTESYKKGRYLVQLCKSQHRFHMAVRAKTNIAHQFQNDYGIEGESYSLASGSLRYANHYEPNDEFDYSDGEQSVIGSVPSELGASSYTIDSMRHHGIPEVKRSASGYEEVRIGRPPPTQRKSPERRPQPSVPDGNRQQRSNQVNEPYRNQTSGSRSNVSRQRVLRKRQQTQDEYDGNVYVENGFEEVDRGRPRSRQGSREVIDDPPYATIESIKENRERSKQNRSRTPKIRGEESGYAEIGPRDTEKPYIIGTSIHNDTRAQSRKSLDQDESISESLRERLEDLPPSERPERDIIIVTLKKSPQKGLGLTIVGGENSRSLDLGIFVRSIEPHGPAHRDGRLHVGDRIISINGQSLEGVGHRVAVDIIKNAPEVVQLIVSQPKSGLNSKLSSTPSTEVVYANVHHPANTHPPNLTPNHQSQGSLENIQDLPNESSASDNSPKLRNKQFPPTKPRRRPESFGSSYSLNSDQERNGLAEGKHGRYLTVEKPRIVKRKGVKVDDEEEEEDDKGRITERDEDVSRMTPEDLHPKRNERDEEPASAGILDNLSADEWEDLDHDDDMDSKVTTPESSDMEDLFGDMDEKKNKPKLNFSKMSAGVESPPITATASTVTAMSPSSDGLMSATSPPARETERDNTEAEQEENLDEEVQEASEGLDLLPGDKYTVQLKKVNGSLGISVTGGVNTSVKHGGIYIKTMVPGGAADVDGRIKSGDRLLEVNGSSLTQVTHKQAVEILRRAKDLSTLVIERGIPPAATSALPPTPVHFQQPMQQQQQQPQPQGNADPKGGNVDESGSGRGLQKDSIANQKTGAAGKEDIRPSTNDEHSGTDFATENEDLDLGSADEEYETGWDDEEDDAPISKSDPMTVKEPTVAPTKIMEQHSVAPSTGAMVLPDIKGDPSEKEQIDPDIDDTEPPVSPSSDDVALSPTDIHRMRSPQFHAQRKNSLGVIFHHDLEGSLASIRRTSSAASLGIHSEHTESDDGGSLMMPSFASHATTPTIEALQDDEYFHTPPLTDNDYASENEVEDVPEDDDVRPESRGSVTESPFASDGYSDEVDDYLAEIASPTLSTREADTLTPTAHLTGLRKSGKRKSWVSVASSHSPAPTESTQFGRTESSPRSSRRSQASHYSESAESAESAESGSEESGSMSFSDNDIAGHWSDNEEHKLVKSKLPAESTPKDANFVSRVAIKSPTSPEPPSESIQTSPDSHPPSVPTVSPPHSSRSSSPTLSQASQISVTSPVPNEEVMSPDSTLSSVGALTLTQTMLSQTMMSTGYMSEIDMPNLPYVTAENTFEVQLNKGSQGLGFSVMGGKGTHTDPRKCLIRIKKLFAGQAASQSGLVEEGDVILAVNGEMVHGATHPETVAKLRGAQQNVKLLLCRPSEEELLRILKKKSEESSAKENTAPPSPLDASGGNNNSTILSSPFSSPPLSPDPKISSAPLSPAANEPPPPPPPPTSPPHSEDEDSGEDVTDQSAPLDRSLPSEKPSPLSKMAAVDRSAFVEVPSALPKLGAVEVKSKIPISSKSKSQDLGMKGKPLLSPSPSTESSPRKMQQIMSEPSVDFEEDDVFEVHLVKPQRGGLGFTVAGGANTGGCYIKDILQEPAISDGRLRKGDKILEVNGRSMKGMSHFDAVSYLRMTPKEVILKVAHPSVKLTQPTPSPTKPVKTDSSASPMPKEDVVVPEAAMDVQASPSLAPAVDGGVSRKDSLMSASASENDDDWSDVGSVESTPPTPKMNLREAFHARPKLQKSQDVNLDQEQKIPDSPSLEDLPSVVIKKNEKGQLGLLLGVEVTDQGSGLFVKDVVKGLPMAEDGSVQVGDQIHFINDQSVSGISMEKAKSLLARVPSLVELKATRNKIPVQPRRQRPVSSASTLEPTETEDEERATPSAQEDNDDEWMTDSSEPPKEMGVPRTLPATPKGEAPEKKGKEVSPAGFDLDLGDVSEEESDWEDLSVSDKEEASRLDEVGDIMKDLERSHGGYTPQQSVDEEAKSPTHSVTSPSEIPTSPTSVASPPLSPLSPSTVPSTVKAFSSITEAPSPSLPDGASDQHDGDLDSLGSNEAFSPSTTPQDPSTPERFNGSPRRIRHDSTEQELEPELAHLPPLPAGKASSTTPRGIKSPLGNFRRQMSLDARDSPTGSEFSTSARIGTPTGRPPSVQGSEGGNLSIGEGGIVWIELEKPEGGGLGFSVVGAEKGGKTSIFIKTVTPDGVAGRDGRLKVGDRLLQVNGQSLVGMTQNKVINILRKSKGVIRLAVTGQLSRPASLIGTDTERQTPSVAIDRLGRAVEERETSDAELSPAESYTESARDAGFRQPLDDDLSDHDEITAGSVTFDSSLSFTLPFSLAGLHSTQTFGDVAITPPPPEFRVGYPEQDTDSDIDSTADLPNDVENPQIPESPGKTSASLLAAQRLGRALQNRNSKQESDEDSLSWGSDNSLPLEDDNEISEAGNGAMRGTPSTKILEDITDAQLESMAIVKPSEGGRYSGRGLRSSIAKIQKQIDKQDPAEEFKTLRQVKAIDNCEEAKKAQNKDKNRFRNVLPYDKTRVILEDSGPSDYINASHIKVQVGKDNYEYIACQGPLPNTTQDFWLMVWEQKADVIAMVTMDVENGKVKCHRYWPESANTPLMVYNRIEVRLENYQILENFTIRRILMIDTETSEVHHVTQMNFATWPDHSVPSTSLPLLRFACHMRRIHDNRLPIVVHCSAGIGRTGTLITLDVILGLIDRDEEFKVLNIVKGLRKQRQGMIQTKDQYIFCYKASLEALKTVLR